MPYVPREAFAVTCAHCSTVFSSRHQRRKYCSNSCNVLASQTRRKASREPVDSSPELGMQFTLSPAMHAVVGPIEQTSPFHYLIMDEGETSQQSRIVAPHRSQQPVRWVAFDTQEPFTRQDFLVGLDGTVWLQAYGYEGRFFQVVIEIDVPTALRLAGQAIA